MASLVARAGEHAALREGAAAVVQREGDVGERLLRVRARCAASRSLMASSAWPIARRQQEQLVDGAPGAAVAAGRRLLEHDVRVGAADAERVDGGAARRAGRGASRCSLSLTQERARREVDRRVGRLEVQARRDLPVLQRERGLDQARDAGGGVEVADVAS